MIIPTEFYKRNTAIVARELLGKRLVSVVDGVVVSGMIVETEAYGGSDDQACHAFRGNTPRTAPLYGPVGHLYVYFIYGNHFCVNTVARDEQTPFGGVLIRALEPKENVAEMKARRQVADELLVTNGPGKLTQALAIGLHHNNVDITKKESIVYVMEDQHIAAKDVIVTSRIGISKSQDKLYRFYIKNNPWVSKR